MIETLDLKSVESMYVPLILLVVFVSIVIIMTIYYIRKELRKNEENI